VVSRATARVRPVGGEVGVPEGAGEAWIRQLRRYERTGPERDGAARAARGQPVADRGILGEP